jgi:hypothetical protein
MKRILQILQICLMSILLMASSIVLLLRCNISWPIKVDAPITMQYGSAKNPFTGIPIFWKHLCLATPIGTEVFPIKKGKVISAGYSELGWGYNVVIRHNFLFKSLYAHFQKIIVEVGDIVTNSTILGLSGMTGFTTGNVLSIKFFVFGLPISPVLIMKEYLKKPVLQLDSEKRKGTIMPITFETIVLLTICIIYISYFGISIIEKNDLFRKAKFRILLQRIRNEEIPSYNRFITILDGFGYNENEKYRISLFLRRFKAWLMTISMEKNSRDYVYGKIEEFQKTMSSSISLPSAESEIINNLDSIIRKNGNSNDNVNFNTLKNNYVSLYSKDKEDRREKFVSKVFSVVTIVLTVLVLLMQTI